MTRQRAILPRQAQKPRKQSSSPVRHSATGIARWGQVCAQKTQKQLKDTFLFKLEDKYKSITHLYPRLTLPPRLLLVPFNNSHTPLFTLKEFIAGHVAACCAIPALSCLLRFNWPTVPPTEFKLNRQKEEDRNKWKPSASVSISIHPVRSHVPEICPTCLTSLQATHTHTPTRCDASWSGTRQRFKSHKHVQNSSLTLML